MSDDRQPRTPFVLGKPIKNPADFYGREAILSELFEAVLNAQPVALVGEHRCGNTSVIYQMLHPDVRAKHLTRDQDDALQFVFLSAQLAADGPAAFFRRVRRAVRRADEDADVGFEGDTDQVWLEDYLEDLADRGKRLVLLLDEFEVLSGFRPSFWEWFEGLVNEYDLSIIATTRMDLGRFRAEKSGPPFFNMFRTVRIGSFTPETVATFLREKSEITDFDFMAVADTIAKLAGRFPYYIQVAAALFYLNADNEGAISDADEEAVSREFLSRTRGLFEDAWPKLPQIERDALTWLVLGSTPSGDDEKQFLQALESLDNRGYVVDGRIFSCAFAEYIRSQLRRIGINTDTGKARVERELVELPPREAALLAYLITRDGEVVKRDELAKAVWPELSVEGLRVDDEVLDETIRNVAAAIDDPASGFTHIEKLGPSAIMFLNTDFPAAGGCE
ncbi:MAG: winged helix-turn-helix domain-containing protein [Anaerolineae bacterium]